MERDRDRSKRAADELVGSRSDEHMRNSREVHPSNGTAVLQSPRGTPPASIPCEHVIVNKMLVLGAGEHR